MDTNDNYAGPDPERVSLWSATADASTFTISDVGPTLNEASTVTSPRTCTVMFDCVNLLKPGCSTLRVYTPGSTNSNA